jgi:hypothetical protein
MGVSFFQVLERWLSMESNVSFSHLFPEICEAALLLELYHERSGAFTQILAPGQQILAQ